MTDRWRVFANLATLANALVGVGAVLYVLAGNKLWAMFLIAAGIGFDGMDGLFSRRSPSPSGAFGRVADSIADAITFGLAPALLLVVHREDASVWAPWSLVALVVGGAYFALAVGRLIYYTGWGFERAHFLGVPTPQSALAVSVLVLFFDVPAFASPQPVVVLLVAPLVAALMAVPIPFPKIRRGSPLRPWSTATAIGLALALLILQFRPASGSGLYDLALAAAGVGTVGVLAYYLGGPLTADRRRSATGGQAE